MIMKKDKRKDKRKDMKREKKRDMKIEKRKDKRKDKKKDKKNGKKNAAPFELVKNTVISRIPPFFPTLNRHIWAGPLFPPPASLFFSST